jgi:hypothetical protein
MASLNDTFGFIHGRAGHGASGGSSEVWLGPAIPYHFMACMRPAPSWSNGCLGVGCQQGEFSVLVTEIMNSPCWWLIPDRLLAAHKAQFLRGMAKLRDTLHGPFGHPSSYA